MAPTQPYDLSDGAGIQAFDWNNSFRALTGSAVVSGAAVSINTGTLGNGNNTLTVAAGTVLVERTSHSIDSQSVDVNAGEGDPRWTVVAVDDTGTVTTIDGTPEEVLVAGESSMASHRAVERPAPPDLVDSSVTPLALIWVGANETEITSDEVFDARAPSDWHAGQLVVESGLDADTLDGLDSTDYVKQTDSIDADTLDSIDSTQFLRSDQDDITTGVLGLESAGSLNGTLGEASGEVTRAGAGAGDFVLSIQGGHGRVVHAWNAYYDGSDWRYVSANEPAAAITWVNSSPGAGTGQGNMNFAVAPQSTNADDIITWEVMSFVEGGDLDLNDGEMKNARVENRTADPASPSAGREWLRTDL